MPPKKSKSPMRSKPKPRAHDYWERGWLEHWSKAGSIGYELPKSGDAGAEATFLTEVRSPERETERLDRIQKEFVRGFESLYEVGPAVTVFGSARFKGTHPYYKLARAVGKELAERVVVRAKVHTLGGFSAHAGQKDLLNWLSAVAPSKPRVVLTHGEDMPRKALAEQVHQHFKLNTSLPRMGEVIEL